MTAGSKEKELEDTLPGAEELAVSAEASELRRRLLAVGSNDNAVLQRPSNATSPPVAADQPASNERALRATLQFVRRRPAGNEEVTVTAVSGAPLPSRELPAGQGQGDEAEGRPSRVRIVVPFVAGALLVLVALIHRTLSQSEPTAASALSAPKAAGLLAPPPRPHVPAPAVTPPPPSASTSVKLGAPSAPPSPRPSADAPRPPEGDEATRHLAAARSKAPRGKSAPIPRESARVAEPTPSSPEPTPKAAPPEPAPPTKLRPRLVDDAPRPGLLD